MKTALLRTIGCIGLIAILFSTIANTTILRSGLPGDLPSDKSQADATYNHAGSVSRTEAEIGAAAPVVLGPVFSSCPGNISVNNDAGTCGAVVNYTAPAASEPARDTTITIPYSKNAIDSFKVPNNVTSLTIRAVGAAGGNRGATLGGKPASIQGVFAVTPGQKLYYLIGQKGGAFTPTTGGAGGGGGTFVTTDASFSSGLLLAAAGGGGVSLNATNAAAVIDGNSGLAANSGAKPNTNYAPGDGGGATSPAQAAIGVNGSKGNKGGAGGAGWTANGEDADTSLGAGTGGIRPFAAAANNGVPGGVPAAISNNGVGGYGGGGSGSNAGGGGGGFNGGGGGSKSSISSTSGSYGGGGGSYNGGTSQLNQKGSETTDVTASTNGFITIKWTINPVVTVTQTAGLASGSTFPVGTTTNTFVATDDLGMQAVCTFTVTVTDNEAPKVTAPANVTVNVDANSCTASNVSLGNAVYSDNCPGVTIANNAPSVFPIGTTTVTWTATDAYSHTATATQTVTVVDNINPTITCPADITMMAPAGQTTATVSYTATAADNCGTPAVTYSIASGSTFSVGTTTTVTVTATDAAGNTATCSFKVTITGSTPATALNFDGVDDKVTVNNNTLGNFGTGDFTVEMSIRTTLSSGIEYLASKRGICGGDNFWSLQIVNGKLNMEMQQNLSAPTNYVALIGTTTISDGNWHHVALTRQLGNVNIYVDGALELTSNATVANINNTYTLEFGSSICNGTGTGKNGSVKFIGDMDEIRIWSRALCTEELDHYRHCELTLPQTGLKAYYKLNAGFINANNAGITTAVDETGNNNATLSNTFGLTGTTSNWVAGTVSGTCSPFLTGSASITGTATVCIGSTTQLSATPSGGTWASSNSSVASVNNTTGLVTGNAAGTATITYTSLCGAVATVTVTVSALPTVSSVTGTNTICSNTTTTLTATSSATSPVFTWYNAASGGSLLSTGASYTTPPLSANTSYYVSVTDANNCVASSRTAVGVSISTINNQTVSASPTALCASGVATVTVASSQTGVNYTLRNNATNAIIAGPIAGTGSAINFSTGTISSSTTYNVLADNNHLGALGFTNPGSVRNSSLALNVSSGFTVEGWLYMNSLSALNGFASQGVSNIGGPFDIYINTSGTMSFWVGNGTASQQITSSPLSAATWYHIACVYDPVAGKQYIYINGVLNNSGSVTQPVANYPGAKLFVGSRVDNGYYLNGKQDEFRIWNTPRTAAQILANMNTCLSTPQTGLSLYYKFDDATGSSTAADASGNGLDGTLTSLNATSAWTTGQLNCTPNCSLQMSVTPTVTVNTTTTPTFTQVAAICSGASLAALPTTSDNGIAGTWSPALNNTATTTYTFTPSAGQCATTATMTITVNALPSVSVSPTSVAICAGSSTTLTASSISTSGLVGYWKFNEGSGTTAADASGNNLTATFQNGSGWTSSTAFTGAGSAATFQNGGRYMSVNDNPVFNTMQTHFTIEAWIYQTDNADNAIVDRGDYNFLLESKPNGHPGLGFYNNGSWTYSTSTLPVNTWVHVACTWDGSTIRFYTNGVQTDAIVRGGTLSFGGGPVNIGRQSPYTCACNIMDGSIDELRLWNVVKTAAEISTAMNASLPSATASSFTWSPATGLNTTTGTTVLASPSSTATYTVTGTTGAGCSASANTTVTVNPSTTPTFTQAAAICSGSSLSALPTTSTNGITGTWSPALNNTATTTYTFTPNAGQCATTATMTITVNSKVTPTFTQVASICAGTSLSALPTTSTNGITGTWSPALNNTATTTYTFTPNAGQCATTATMTITVNPLPVFFISSNGSFKCEGQTFTTGVTLAGQTYAWTGPNGFTANTQTISVVATPAGLGLYSVVVTDANGCHASGGDNYVLYPTPVISGTTSVCAGGTKTLSGSGTPAVSNAWTSSVPSVATVSSSGVVSGLTAGTTIITYTNSNGCSTTANFTVNASPVVNILAAGPTTFCEGGSVTLNANTEPGLTYSWTGGSLETAVTESSISVNTSGTYTLTGTSASGCASSASVTVVVNPNPAKPTISGPAAVCVGGTAVLTSSPAAFYMWNYGPGSQSVSNTYETPGTYTYSVTITDNNHCQATSDPFTVTVNDLPTIGNAGKLCIGGTRTLTGSGMPAASNAWVSSNTAVATIDNNGVITGVTAGHTNITYTNSNGCSVTVFDIIVEGQPVVGILPNGPTTFCAGGSVVLNANTEPGLTYSWAPGGSTASSITVNASGTYTLTGTSATGCFSSTSVTITVNPLPAVPTISGATSFCQGGSTVLTASAAASYQWSNGPNSQSITVFSAGKFAVTVIDGNNCSATSAPVIVTVNPKPVINVDSKTNSQCFGSNSGAIDISVSSGTAPYAYSWSNGATTQDLSNLAPGTYTLTVTDAAGCSATSAGITISEPLSPISLTYGASDPSCVGASDGQFTINATGGTPGYTYSVNGGAYQSSPSYNGLPAGVYFVTIKDAAGCTFVKGIVLTDPQAITVFNVTGSGAYCAGTGGLPVGLSGSQIGISYQLKLSGSVNIGPAIAGTGSALSFGNQPAGNYTVVAYRTAATNCTANMSGSAVITQTPLPSVINYTLTYACDGTATLTANNVSGSILWSPTNATTNSIHITNAGNYSAVQTVNGCTSVPAPVHVSVYAVPAVFNVSGGGSYCAGGSGVAITLSGSQTGVSYQLRLSGSPIGSIIAGTGAPLTFNAVANGTYTVVAHNDSLPANCFVSMSGAASVAIHSAPQVITCAADQNLSANGSCKSTASYGFNISSGSPSTSASYVFTGATTGSGSGTGSGSSFNVGVTTVAVTFTNECGSVSCSFKITVTDISAPVVSNCPGNITVATGAGRTSCDQVVTWTGPTAIDNCGVTSISSNHNSGDVFPVGTTPVTYTFRDAAGNFATCSFTVTVVDNTAPVVPVLADVIGECSATAPVATAVDACTGIVAGTTSDALTYTTQGSYVIHWTFTDGNGNSSTATQNVIVKDITAPTVSCPDNITVRADAFENDVYGAHVNFTATGADNCGTANITYSIEPGSFFPIGTTTVTVTADDGHGNTATCSFDVTVTCVPPVIVNCPGNIVVDAQPGLCSTQVLYKLFATAVPQANLTYTLSGATTGSGVGIGNDVLFNVGTTTVTVTATNDCGTAECTFNVTVNDTEAPVVNCSPITLSLGADGTVTLGNSLVSIFSGGKGPKTPPSPEPAPGSSSAQPPAPGGSPEQPAGSAKPKPGPAPKPGTVLAAASDNCGVADVSIYPNVFDCSKLGANLVTITVTDVNGNTSSCTATVTIIDDQPPVVTAPDDIVISNTTGQCGAENVHLTAPGVTDNCNTTVTNDAPSFFPVGTTTVTWTVTDAGGNTVTVTQQVTVNDTEAPVAPVLPDITADCAASAPQAYAKDNCGGLIAGTTEDALSYVGQGVFYVNWTFTDAAGNTSTAVQKIILKDVTPPVINCPIDIVVDADVVENGISGAHVSYAATATDNCGVPEISYSTASGDFFSIGTHTVTVTVTDGNGNTSTCDFHVIVNCVKPVVTSCPADIATVTDAAKCGAVVTYTSSFNLGLPAAAVSYSFSGATSGSGAGTGSGSVFNTGTTLVTITASNDCGRAVCSFNVVVRDVEKPTITAPADVVVSADANCRATNVNLGTPVYGDNCGVDKVTTDASGIFPLGTTVVTWIVYDVNGNSNTATQNVTVVDNTKPNLTCPTDIVVDADVTEHGVSGAHVNYTATATDNCGTVTLAYSVMPGGFFAIGTHTVTVTATDANGNVSTCDFNVTVKCVTPVLTTCPGNLTANTDAGKCSAVVNYNSSFSLGLPAAGVHYTFSGATNDAGTGTGSGAAFNTGITYVTITASNDCGDAVCRFTVTVKDIEKPTITAPADVIASADANCQGTNVNLGTPVYGDNCGVDKVTNDASGIFPLGTTTVTWIVYDVNGNYSTATQQVTVVDKTRPNLTCPADLVLTANTVEGGVSGAHASYAATAKDNCGLVTVTYSVTPGSFFAIGTTTVTVTATDDYGNTSTCDFHVTVNCVKPVIASCPADQTVNTDLGKCSAKLVYKSLFDLGLPAAAVSYSFSGATTGSGAGTGSGSVFNTGTTVVTITAANICGTAVCSFNVVVRDVEKPTITAPADVVVAADANCQATGVSLGSPATGDNCGVKTVTNNAPTVFPLGTTTVTWTVCDINGNKTTATQQVTVVDKTKPNLTCPADVVLTANTVEGGIAGAHASYAATAKDNCGLVTVTYSVTPGSFFAIGTTTVTVTATDDYGNTSTCDFHVTVNCVKPVIASCPADQTVNTDLGKCSARVVYNSSFDLGLPAAAVSYSFSGATTGNGAGTGSGAVFNTGITVVTITAANICGTAVCSFQVTVKDAEKPTITAPADVTANADANCQATGVFLGSPVTGDNCGVKTVTNNAPTVFPLGTTTVTWTVCDINGNKTTATQQVTVVDKTKPNLTCPTDVVLTANTVEGGIAGAHASYAATASDNCGSATVTYSVTPGSFFAVGSTTVTVTATDANGNKSTCDFHVIVNCVQPKVIACPANQTVNTDLNKCSAAVTYVASFDLGLPVGTLNYSFSGATTGNGSGNGSGSVFNKGVTTVTLTASNVCGTVSKSFNITVEDHQDPVITAPASITVYANSNCQASGVNLGTPVTSDNCGVQSVTNDAPVVYNIGTTVVTWNVKDLSGNYNTAKQEVKVVDTTKPKLVCPVDIVVSANASLGGQPGAYVTYSASATDNCGSPVVTYSTNSGGFFPVGTTTVTVTAKDASGNTTTCSFKVTVGCVTITPTLTSVPTSNTYTAAAPTSLFIGYGAQSTVLQVGGLAAGTYTYAWSGSAVSRLSSTSTANPVFTPAAAGSYTFTVTVTNSNGCKGTASITICVTDIRVLSSNDDDDDQKMCDHQAHDSDECPHKGHNHYCDHKSHSKYSCSHRDTNDRDDDDEQDCDHKAHSASDCSHKGHNHTACNHKAHSAAYCEHDKSNNNGSQKVCDHKAHYAADCSHYGHHHGYCDHKAHDASNCPHENNGGNDTNYKVYICHVPPGNPGKTLTLSISINAVAAHLANHSGDRLGSCEQAPCSGAIDAPDTEKPVITVPANTTVSCGASTAPSATGTATATDNSGSVTVTYSDVTSGNTITRTWKAIDPAGNYVTGVQVITVSIPFSPVLSSTPNSSVNTGGVSTNLYIGYGATATTLSVGGNLPSSGAPYTYSWNGGSTASSLVFTPTAGGAYTFTVKVTNKYGCASTQSITICVKDIRERDRYNNLTNSGKVYVCHVPPGNPENAHTICISVNAVPAHVPLHGGDMLGSCDQSCGSDVISKPPVMSCPSNITVSCISASTPASCGTPVAIDKNGKYVTVTYSDDVDGNIITRTWTATDAAGNFTVCDQIITVIDNIKPVISDPADITVNCGGSILPSATGMATASDNCSAVTVTYSDLVNGNVITRTWKATDASGNYSTSVQTITIGSAFSPSITSVPTSSTYTGGVATNLYLGYGAQSTTLQVCTLPSAGAPYTYSWSGSAVSRLSSTSSAAPVFTPSTYGTSTFVVTVTNKYGCASTAYISICVTDIRVPGTNGAKVYVCHTPTGKYSTPQTLQLLISQVSSHLGSYTCGSNGTDRLGSCDQTPCNSTSMTSVKTVTQTATAEGGETVKAATTNEDLKVTVMPNPSTTFFTLKLESRFETPVNLRVMDDRGRVVDAKSKLGANSTLQIGHNYSSGTYYAELIQGGTRKVVQLIKAR